MSRPITSKRPFRTLTLLPAVAFLATLAFFGTGVAAAATPRCGDTITADTTLTADLNNCPDNGILIGADNVTLDLNGHAIDGDGKLRKDCPKNTPCDLGVLIEDHDGVTITGGTVEQFGTGVLTLGGKDNLLADLTASRNYFNGMTIVDATRSAIKGSTVTANGLETDYPGIALVTSSQVLIKGTTSSRNADIGLWVVDSDDNRWVGNTFEGNSEAGINFEGDGNEVLRNQVVGNGDGIVFGGSDNTIVGNRVLESNGFGKHPRGVGISLEDGHDNVIAANQVEGAGEAAIRLTTFVKQQGLDDNVVSRNSIDDPGLNGVFVGPGVDGTLLKRNVAEGAEGDGIHVESASTTLTRNEANANAELGIAAVEGVTDGGGNTAAGNGDPRQCTFVVCG